MKIGIIGSGDVGQALGKGFIGLGHQVKIGSRDPESEKLKHWTKSQGELASTGTFSETAVFGELLVVATKGVQNSQAITLAEPKNFANKVVIDVTNPLDFSHGPLPTLAVGFTTSGGEQLQAQLPEAKIVKTLNIVGNPMMVSPSFEEGDPDMLLCGNDEGAKQLVTQLLRDFGWKNITDLGGIEQSRITEPLCILWVYYGAKNNTWNHAFKMLRK